MTYKVKELLRTKKEIKLRKIEWQKSSFTALSAKYLKREM